MSKTSKKTDKTSEPKRTSKIPKAPSDSERFDALVHTMIEKIDAAIKRPSATSDEEDVWLQHHHERLFGKMSVVAAMEIVAQMIAAREREEKIESSSISDNEERLYNDLIARIRGYDAQ